MKLHWAAPIVLVLVGVAFASDKDLKEARKAFSEAATSGDQASLARAAARLVQSEPPRGALELVEGGLVKGGRRAALASQAELSHAADARIARALASRLSEIHEARARRLLAGALASVPGDEVGRALVRALSDREPTVRAAAALALAQRDQTTAALSSGALRERVLHDPSPRVRKAAATASERLGLGRYRAYDEPPSSSALPARFFVERALFLIDASEQAREPAYALPDLDEGPHSGDTAAVSSLGHRAPGPARVAEGVSAFAVAARTVSSALVRLDDDQSFDIATFQEGVRSFAGHFARATPRTTAQAYDWLRSPFPGGEGRDVIRALRDALESNVAPDEIHVFLCGPPEGRSAGPAEAAAQLADLAWERGVVVDVVLLELAPAGEAANERERLERERASSSLRAFADGLAGPTGGTVKSIALLRRGTGREIAAVSSATPSRHAPGLKLVNGRLASSDLSGLRRTLDEATKSDPARVAGLVTDLAASPDPDAASLAVRALFQNSLELQRAALEGFSGNREPRVHALIAQELRSQPDPVRGVLLARALASMPGPDVTRALALEAERREGSGDLPRLLFEGLVARPPEDLAAITSEVLRAAYRPRAGLAGFLAGRARDLARGAPTAAIASLPDDLLLPERFQATGVGFLVDTERGMDSVFARRPSAARPPAAVGGRHDRAAPPPITVTRRTAVQQELERALDLLAESHGRANLFLMGDEGRSYRTSAVPLSHAALPEAFSFVSALPQTASREVLRPLGRALDDPEIEEVWVLTCGIPVRSERDSDLSKVRRDLTEASLRRAVKINVILPLGPVEGDDPALAQALRLDELKALEAFWRPIAETSGGCVRLRERLRERSDAPSRPAGARPPLSPPRSSARGRPALAAGGAGAGNSPTIPAEQPAGGAQGDDEIPGAFRAGPGVAPVDSPVAGGRPEPFPAAAPGSGVAPLGSPSTPAARGGAAPAAAPGVAPVTSPAPAASGPPGGPR